MDQVHSIKGEGLQPTLSPTSEVRHHNPKSEWVGGSLDPSAPV